MDSLSKRLSEALYDSGMKAIDLSRKTGIDKGSISHYLSGRYDPSPKKRKILANALGVSEAWLLGYDVPKEPPSEADSERKAETIEQELRDRMLEHICQIFKQADFSAQIKIYEAVRLIEMGGTK